MVKSEDINQKYEKNLEIVEELLKKKEKKVEEVWLETQSLNQQLAKLHNSKIRWLITWDGEGKTNRKIVDCLITINELNNEISEIIKKKRNISEELQESKGKEVVKLNTWQDIHPNFTFKLQKQWEKEGFDAEKCKEWLDIGMEATDSGFCAWLRDVKKKDIEWVVNRDKEDLGREYEMYKKEYENDLHELNLPHGETTKNEPLKSLFYSMREAAEIIHNNDGDGYSNYSRKWEAGVVSEIKKNINVDERKINTEVRMDKLQNPLFINGLKSLLINRGLTDEQIDEAISSSFSTLEAQENDFCKVQKNKTLNRIPYGEFNNIQYVGEGGFSKVYKANWRKLRKVEESNQGIVIYWNPNIDENRSSEEVVALKVLNNSRNITVDFVQVVVYNMSINCVYITKCYGISRDPETGNYVIVMKYENGGGLREYLKNNRVLFKTKLNQLLSISTALDSIHRAGLIHCDLHLGNVLDVDGYYCHVTDLGLCRPVSEKDDSKIYGVLSHVAPEVLRGEKYTQATDIYSFGIVAYEILSGLFPYHNFPHSEPLAIRICQGLRPDLNSVKAPQMLKDLISRCWNADPLQRPVASELYYKLLNLRTIIDEKQPSTFYNQYKEIEEFERRTGREVLKKLYKQYKNKEARTEKLEDEEVIEIMKELYEEFCKKHKYEKYSEKSCKEFRNDVEQNQQQPQIQVDPK